MGSASGQADQLPIAQIELLSGPLAVEDRLLCALESQLAAGRSDSGLLARPVVVAVPSASLRAHIAARVVERVGGPVAGLSIVTLRGLAQRIMRSAGEQSPLGAALMPLVVRDLARSEPVLFARLDSLVDGYGAVEASVADLLDAGLEAVHAEALDERLADLPARGASSRVARAVVRLACRVARALEEEGLGSRAYAFRRAAELLAQDPSCLVARAVFVHGFADATGCACDLIAALLRFHSATVLIDEPPDPSSGEPLQMFSSHFRERLESWGRVSRPPDHSVASRPVVPHCVVAPGGEAEVRFAAVRIAALLRDGALPESIAVVARDVSSYATLLRVHFPRLGVPFSGIAPVVAGGALARRLTALVAILRQRGRCPSDRWLDGLAGLGGVPVSRVQRADLRLSLRHLGAARLEQLSELADGPLVGRAGGVALSVRRGRDLSAACGAAVRALARLAEAPDDHFESHCARVRALALQDLGWRSDAPEIEALFKALDSLANDVPPLQVSFDDFAHLLSRVLVAACAEPLGGAGAGVQVLSVMEARARTFTHLFVLGMNRDVFPRGIREDPLLGDSLRRSLSDLLPDIPIKQRGYDEERHLFAQLLASSDRVTLSWQSVGDNGKPAAASTLIERLRWAAPGLRVEVAPALHSAASLPVPAPASEHALRAALYGEGDSLGCALEAALEERAANAVAANDGTRSVAGVDVRRLAAARLAVIREFDGSPGRGRLLGPYFGFVGRQSDARDPRLAKPYVTALEQLARCPWKSFLERTLRIEPVPDPIETLPEVDALLLGTVVHRVLERMGREVLSQAGQPDKVQSPKVRSGASGNLAELAAAGEAAVPLAWPGDAEVFGMLGEEALALLAERGLALAGLVQVLVAQAWQRLERARDLEWPTPETQIALAAVELEGNVRLTAGSHTGSSVDSNDVIYFRADRVDLVDGAFVLTDYKTGRPPSQAVRPETRRRHFEARVRRGEQLQAVAYALAAAGLAPSGTGAVGRYLYLTPDVEGVESSEALDSRLEYLVHASDTELVTAFERASRVLLAARKEGSFAPRLVEPDGLREPALCGRCNVAEACLRGDSGARGRMAAWTVSKTEDATPAERALRAVWNLAAPPAEGAR